MDIINFIDDIDDMENNKNNINIQVFRDRLNPFDFYSF